MSKAKFVQMRLSLGAVFLSIFPVIFAGSALAADAIKMEKDVFVFSAMFGEYEGKTPTLLSIELEGKRVSVPENVPVSISNGSGTTTLVLEDVFHCTITDTESRKVAATANRMTPINFVGNFKEWDGRVYRFSDCRLTFSK